MDEPKKGKEVEGFEVTELDDRDLEGVAGGCVNGNCNGCAPGTPDPNGCDNANCNQELG